MKRIMFLMATVASLFLFTGCGQSGPLYVPGNPSQMAVPPSRPDADETDETDEGEQKADDDAGTK